MGANPKQTLFPIISLVTIFIIYIVFKGNEKYLTNQNLNTIIVIFFITNLIIYITGKFNVESGFLKIIKTKFGINMKLVMIISSFFMLLKWVFIKNNNLLKDIFIYTIIFFVIPLLLIPFIYPNPDIDLYIILKQSIRDLSLNIDPYLRVYPDIYKGAYDYAYQKQPVKLVYWPMNLYLLYPFQHILGDLRWGYIFSLIFGVLILFFGIERKWKVLFISGILLFGNAFTFHIIRFAWIDPLTFPITALYFVFTYKNKYFLSFVFLGILVSLKLYFIFFIPISMVYYLKNVNSLKKAIFYLFVTVMVAILCFVPFIFSNTDGIIYSLKYFANSRPRLDSLSIPGYLFKFKYETSNIFMAIFFVLYVWILYRSYNNNKEIQNHIADFGVVLFIFFIFSKQAFGNYYYNLIYLSIMFICFKSFSIKRIVNSQKHN